MVDETTGYTKTINKGDRYIYIGLIPPSFVSTGTLMGFKSNGQSLAFINCDGNPNSYFALFSNVPNPSNYAANTDIQTSWIDTSLPHPIETFMPSTYFYFAESHQGGCGGYLQNDQFYYDGLAVGFK